MPSSSTLSSDQLQQIEAFAVDHCAGYDAAHDALHLRRVLANARAIVDDEVTTGTAVRRDIIEAACWLHDLVQLPKGTGPAGESARRSASEARALLTRISIDAIDLDRIAHAIDAHSFSGGIHPETIEAAVVQDADRLDALGAVGLARMWVTAAELGSTLYHVADPLGAERELDDRMFGLDHIERKLLTLPATMNTRLGRVEAERRARYIFEYRGMFMSELAGSSPIKGGVSQ